MMAEDQVKRYSMKEPSGQMVDLVGVEREIVIGGQTLRMAVEFSATENPEMPDLGFVAAAAPILNEWELEKRRGH
jgi:hypothetical protein